MRQIPMFFRVICAFLILAGVARAQPSGGPYGPLPQTYPIPETGTVIFVAPDGNPAASGATVDEPTNLETAIAQATTGAAIILRGGLYRTGGLHFNQGITLQPHADEQPVLTGTRQATEWEVLSDGQWRTAWTTLFPAAPADWWRAERNIEQTPLHRFNYDMVFVDGDRLMSADSRDAVSADSYYIDYERGWVYLGTDPADREVEITAHDSALVRTIRAVHGMENDRQGPTIRGLTFTRYARLALLVEGVEPQRPMSPDAFGKEVVGTTLENVTISHCSRVAGYFRGDELTIRQSLIEDCGTEGIYVINSADILLERNIVTRTNAHAPFAGYYASAIKIFNQSYRAVVRDNLIIDNPNASGIWYDVGNIDGIIVNNWVERTNDGFFFEISQGAICAGNVFLDCSPGIRVLNSADVSVYQNTFYNSALEFNRSMRSSEAGDHFGWHASAGPSVAERDGHIAQNNLFVGDASFSPALVQFWEMPGVAEVARGPQVAALDGNVYVRRDAENPLASWGEAAHQPPARVTTSLDALRGESEGYETNGEELADYQAQVVVSDKLKRLELLESFPGTEAGLPLPPEVIAALGWTEDAAQFPGAYAPR